MVNFIIEVLLIIGLILVNGLLAMSELAIVASRKARLQQQADAGSSNARSALDILQKPGDFLSTVQVGITLVGVLAGVFGGATVAGVLKGWIERITVLAPYSEEIALALVVLMITYVSLIIGELVPKRLALNNPEKIALFFAPSMHRLSRILYPVVRFLSFSSEVVLRLLGVRSSVNSPVTAEEIKVMVEQGRQAGVFEQAEQTMVEGVFRLGDRLIGNLITPRTEIIWLDLDDPLEVNQRKIAESKHARFPVAKGSLDNVEGVVDTRDLLACHFAGKPLDLMGCMNPPVFVPTSSPALKVLDLFKQTYPHLVLVIDEFGGLQGLVTMTDILEAIVGEISEAGRTGEHEVLQREDGSWLVDGMLPIDEFKETLKIRGLPDENKGYYYTLGGFIMNQLGRIPRAGDHFQSGDYCYEVMDMDGFRVDKVLVSSVELEAQV